MKKIVLSLSIAAGVLVLGACSGDGSSKEEILKSDAGNITKDELYTAMKDQYGATVLQSLMYEKVLEDKYKVDEKEIDTQIDEIKSQLGDNFETALQSYGYKDEDALRKSIKLNLLQQEAAIKEIKVTDKEIKEYYDNYKPEIKASHILVADEKTAKEVKKKLDAGEKFADLAKEYSTDTATKEKGGDLGWFGTGKMDADFEAAAYALKKGEISAPVKSQYGYHIIELTDKKAKGKYEDVKAEMEKELKISKVQADTTAMTTAMEKEIKDANVKITDKDLKSILPSSSSK